MIGEADLIFEGELRDAQEYAQSTLRDANALMEGVGDRLMTARERVTFEFCKMELHRITTNVHYGMARRDEIVAARREHGWYADHDEALTAKLAWMAAQQRRAVHGQNVLGAGCASKPNLP